MKPYGRSDGNVSENRRWASQIYGRALWLGPAEPVSARCGARADPHQRHRRPVGAVDVGIEPAGVHPAHLVDLPDVFAQY